MVDAWCWCAMWCVVRGAWCVVCGVWCVVWAWDAGCGWDVVWAWDVVSDVVWAYDAGWDVGSVCDVGWVWERRAGRFAACHRVGLVLQSAPILGERALLVACLVHRLNDRR